MGGSLYIMISGVPANNVQCNSVTTVSRWSSPTDNHTAWATYYKILIYINKGVFVLQTNRTNRMYIYRFIIRNWIMWLWRQVPRPARWITDWGPRKPNGFCLVCVWRPENQENWCCSSYLKANRLETQEKPMFQFKFKLRCEEMVFWGTCARWAKGTKAHKS